MENDIEIVIAENNIKASQLAESAPIATVETKQKKCSIEKALGNTINDLLAVAPNNPIARAHAMSRIKREIPPDIQEYSKIKDWIEENIEVSAVPIQSAQSVGGRATRNRAVAFEIEVEISENEYGKCQYSCTNSGQSDVPIKEDDIIEIVNDCIEDGSAMDDVIESIKDKIRDTAREYISTDGDDYHYQDYEMDDSGGESVDFNTTRLEQKTRDWLLNNHPELLEQLDNN